MLSPAHFKACLAVSQEYAIKISELCANGNGTILDLCKAWRERPAMYPPAVAKAQQDDIVQHLLNYYEENI